mmetsp:Transcript_42171/g.88152  ORF Transcript_42171/g.88152 Transcript_42171/m.88152 type:complete len:85 (-) Transcript_42171:234-488(-)
MPIWHPTSEKALDELLDAEVDVYNVHGLILKKVFVLNKNIVHLIDDIFWNMGFKTETQADKGSSGYWTCGSRMAGQEHVDCQIR